MELKKVIAQAWMHGDDPCWKVPDHDSTLANFDELEEADRNLHDEIIELQDTLGDALDRLTALEAKVEPLQLYCGDCGEVIGIKIHHCPLREGGQSLDTSKVDAPRKRLVECGDCTYETCCVVDPPNQASGCWEGLEKWPPDTCEPKVYAPEKQKQEAELRLRCIGCGKEGVCSQKRSKICDLGGHGRPRCYRFNPPAACGNCRKAARWDDSAYWVVCYVEDKKLKLKSMLCPACPHYDRRKA